MFMEKGFWEDARWGEENYTELQKQFKDKWVAIVDKKVVSYGENRGEVKKRAIELTGKKHIPLIYVESGAAIY
jgi:hypothetical protein